MPRPHAGLADVFSLRRCVLLFVVSSLGHGCSGDGLNVADGSGEGSGATSGLGTASAVTQVVAGAANSCAILDTGGLRCWGPWWGGALGYGNNRECRDPPSLNCSTAPESKCCIGDDETPASAGDLAVGGSVTQVDASAAHTCAVLDDGQVRCWGNGHSGQLGLGYEVGQIGDDEVPASQPVVNVGYPIVTHVELGASYTCALQGDSRVRCWGSHDDGRLGLGHGTSGNDIGDDEHPADVNVVFIGPTPHPEILHVSCGSEHACALVDARDVACWGNGEDGRLGYGDEENIGVDNSPRRYVPLGGEVAYVEAGGLHTCALMVNGDVRCWGNASYGGQLGYGSTEAIGDDELPDSVEPLQFPFRIVQLTVGGAHNCVRSETGQVMCWGRGEHGQLGYGNTENFGDDERVAGMRFVELGGKAIQVDAGEEHTCALLEDGAVRCWGRGRGGVLGHGSEENVGDDEVPASVEPVHVF